jgi:O-methyltransferase
MEITATKLRSFAKWSVMSLDRLTVLAAEAVKVESLAGDVAELGVYYGGSTLLLASVLPEKKVHAFESFEGLVNLSATYDRQRRDNSDRGHLPEDFALSPHAIEGTIQRLTCAGIILHHGSFTIRKAEVESNSFCFAHFDGDTYLSAEEFLEFFYPRLVSGGRILVDDYRWTATPGVTRAVDEFSQQMRLSIYQPGEFQAMFIKE